MTTARDIIEAAHRKISVLGRGEALSADQANDALDMLNAMLSSWSVEGGYVFAETQEAFTLTGAQSYTIGAGGDFDTVLPVEIVAGFVRIGDTDYQLDTWDRVQYSRITQKSLSSFTPDVLYFDYNYPLATIRLYPIDNGGALHLYTTKPLTSFTSLDTVVVMPSGYERALIFNLAVEVAPDYEKEASGTVRQIATDSKDIVFTANTRNDNNALVVDDALLYNTEFNIYQGWN